MEKHFVKLKGPDDVKSVSVEGHRYSLQDDGLFHVLPEHAKSLQPHGFIGNDGSAIQEEYPQFVRAKAPDGVGSCNYRGQIFAIQRDGFFYIPLAAMEELKGFGFALALESDELAHDEALGESPVVPETPAPEEDSTPAEEPEADADALQTESLENEGGLVATPETPEDSAGGEGVSSPGDEATE